MRKLVVAVALSAPLALAFGASPATADPQMLGVVETASAVPLRCHNGECGAELTSICLQELRATPPPGYRYHAHNPETIGLTGIRRDGSRVALVVEEALKFSAARIGCFIPTSACAWRVQRSALSGRSRMSASNSATASAKRCCWKKL